MTNGDVFIQYNIDGKTSFVLEKAFKALLNMWDIRLLEAGSCPDGTRKMAFRQVEKEVKP